MTDRYPKISDEKGPDGTRRGGAKAMSLIEPTYARRRNPNSKSVSVPKLNAKGRAPL